MPAKVVAYSDVKPYPVLWHEDNGNRRQFGRERPQVPGAIRGPQLGEAAHRLLKNTLNIKHADSSPGLLEYMHHQDNLGNHLFNRPRPAGPAGYERGFYNDNNYYYGHHQMPRAMSNGHKLPYEPRGSRQNDRHREDDRDLGASMSNLTLGGARNRPPPQMRAKFQNTGHMPMPNQQNNFVQNAGQLPSPPINWINRPEVGNNMRFRQQEISAQKQLKQVYQAKTQRPTQQD